MNYELRSVEVRAQSRALTKEKESNQLWKQVEVTQRLSWLQDTVKRKLVDFAWNRRFLYLPGACLPFFGETRLNVSIKPIFFNRSAYFDPSSGQPRVNLGKQEGGARKKKIGEFSFRCILQPTTAWNWQEVGSTWINGLVINKKHNERKYELRSVKVSPWSRTLTEKRNDKHCERRKQRVLPNCARCFSSVRIKWPRSLPVRVRSQSGAYTLKKKKWKGTRAHTHSELIREMEEHRVRPLDTVL